jgi:hypothetical protein
VQRPHPLNVNPFLKPLFNSPYTRRLQTILQYSTAHSKPHLVQVVVAEIIREPLEHDLGVMTVVIQYNNQAAELEKELLVDLKHLVLYKPLFKFLQAVGTQQQLLVSLSNDKGNHKS